MKIEIEVNELPLAWTLRQHEQNEARPVEVMIHDAGAIINEAARKIVEQLVADPTLRDDILYTALVSLAAQKLQNEAARVARLAWMRSRGL